MVPLPCQYIKGPEVTGNELVVAQEVLPAKAVHNTCMVHLLGGKQQGLLLKTPLEPG